MHILEVETFGRGGLTHYVYNLSCALAERGHEVTLVTTAGYELEGRSLPDHLTVVRAIARWTQGGEQAPPAAGLLRKLEAVVDAFRTAAFARRLRPDVVHLHSTNASALAYLATLRLAGLPLAATAHVVTPHERTVWADALYRRLHRIPALVIAHSEVDRSRLVEEAALPSERVVVIPHGEYGFFERETEAPGREEARRDLGLEAGAEVALFFGYLREYKGLDVLLDAWPAVRAARPAARLVVAGDPVRLDPRRRAELQSRAERLGAVARFEYIPFPDVSRFFAAADVVVMPYRRISQSGVLFLALALGVPVVATRVGALPEILNDGESALLVPPESPKELASALVRVLGDAALRGRLAEGGLGVARAHSWSAIAERTERAFAERFGVG